jgi:hypothetical protein
MRIIERMIGVIIMEWAIETAGRAGTRKPGGRKSAGDRVDRSSSVK